MCRMFRAGRASDAALLLRPLLTITRKPAMPGRIRGHAAAIAVVHIAVNTHTTCFAALQFPFLAPHRPIHLPPPYPHPSSYPSFLLPTPPPPPPPPPPRRSSPLIPPPSSSPHPPSSSSSSSSFLLLLLRKEEEEEEDEEEKRDDRIVALRYFQ